MAIEKKKTYCRFCHAYCPMIATVEDNRLLALEPDTDNPVYGGYTCIKGRQLTELIYHPERLQRSQKRNADGGFSDVATDAALDEIADQLQGILAKHGPRSIASYNGTHSYQNSAAHAVARAFHKAIDSSSYYTSVTIDQPAKVGIGPTRMGWWGAGGHTWRDADVSLIIGNNTPVSHFSIPGGIPSFSPSNALREGVKRGLKVICVDPRRTEVARKSHLHLQVKPGQDAALVAGMLNIILSENLHDADFCAQHTDNLDELANALQPFTPDKVAEAAGISREDLLSAARIFAAGPRGGASTGTGPEMGPHPNLLQHLVQTLNMVCGRVNRAGDPIPNPGVLTAPAPRRAQATGPQMQWLEEAKRSRISDDIREVTVLSPYGPEKEMPTATLSEEILEPGDGQIKALICVGGNPLLAFPDQLQTHRALQSLELLVCIDLRMSASAKMADYVIAPKISLEREDVTLLTDIWYEVPYSQYSKAVVEAEGDKIEEWELFWELGKRMGLEMSLPNGAIDMADKPSKFDLLENITRGSRVPLADIRDSDGGKIFDVPELIAQEPDPATAGRLELFPAGLAMELAAALGDMDSQSEPHSHLLISRRMKYNYNSSGPELSMLSDKCSTNPAFLNPEDLAGMGLEDGDLVSVSSRHGAIPAVARAADDVRPGVVSMAHCWGAAPEPETDDKVRDIGSNTNRLISTKDSPEKYSGIPRQSTVPVTITPLGGTA